MADYHWFSKVTMKRRSKNIALYSPLTLRCLSWTAAVACGVLCMSMCSNADETISPELIRKYRDAGGYYKQFSKNHYWDFELTQPAFLFARPPTGRLPAVPVPFGLELEAGVFYVDGHDRMRTGTDLTDFLHLMNLTALSFRACSSIEDDIVSQIWRFEQLKHLVLGNVSLSNDDIEGLIALKSLETLEVASVGDERIARLAALPELRALDLTDSRVTGMGFGSSDGFDKLLTLVLDNGANDEGMVGVAHLQQLETLKIVGSVDRNNLTATGIAELAKLEHLRTLVFYSADMNDSTLTAIARINRLEYLDVGGTTISDDGIQSLSNLKKLRHLSVFAPNISGDSLRPLKRLEHLTFLDLTGCTHLTDCALEEIAQFPRLSSLVLDRVPINDTGVKHLTKLNDLKQLSLLDTEVTDECIDDLARMKQLDFLCVAGTNISFCGFDKLVALLPECEVQY